MDRDGAARDGHGRRRRRRRPRAIEGARNLQNLKDTGGVPTQASIDSALNKLNDPNNGLRVDAGTGADFKVGKIAFFANGFLDMGAVPFVDLANNTPGAITGGTNNSKLVLKGARILEFGAGYGHEIPGAPGLFLGGNLKLMNAQVGYADYFILRNNNSQNDLLSKFKNGAKTSSNFGVDLGALWDVERTFSGAWWRPRVGLVGRNLNNPKFKQPDAATAAGVTGKFAVNPQVRLGGAISPFNWWHLVSDVDLTNNLTPVDGVKSRQFGLGTEVNVFNRTWINIPLRFGIARNLANTGSGTMLTGGAGLNFLHFMIDASAQVSPKRVQTQSQGASKKIPSELAAGVQLSLLFGGSDDRPGDSTRDLQPVPTEKVQPTAPAAPDQVEKIKADAEKAHSDLDKEAAKPAGQ
ncbi:MAG: conjugal transfer protein TraF [Elusimicrobia bacterium]|nr:conjugal transfer protein TraF [Elusimicrobiota bacterium]